MKKVIKYKLGWWNADSINGVWTDDGMPMIFSSTFSYGRFLNKDWVENVVIFFIAVIAWLSFLKIFDVRGLQIARKCIVYLKIICKFLAFANKLTYKKLTWNILTFQVSRLPENASVGPKSVRRKSTKP